MRKQQPRQKQPTLLQQLWDEEIVYGGVRYTRGAVYQELSASPVQYSPDDEELTPAESAYRTRQRAEYFAFATRTPTTEELAAAIPYATFQAMMLAEDAQHDTTNHVA